jgi:predicted AlkP superfamily pyrophosphatase or phosphodiesterase
MRQYLLPVFLFLVTVAFGQSAEETKPRIVVGIIVDQMRNEYLYRFGNKFGEGGFNRLMREGFMLKNAHYNYYPTLTGPGHASVYTGTTPAFHGIISNEWYDKNLRKVVYCVEDNKEKVVGSKDANGHISPRRLLSSTITDELKLSTQKRAKVIGISLKDRGSVLSAGHLADAAFWFDNTTGRLVTSTFYMTQLPEWAEKFNKLGLADKYLSQEWKTLYPIEQYTESGPDDSPYETKLVGKEKSTFPYNLKELRKRNGEYDLLTQTPFANDYLTEMTQAAIAGEKLGEDEITDFVALSYSTTDIMGHAVGPNAVEIQDIYLRLDKNIETLLKTLDDKFGKDNYVVFLTADHAVADVAQYLRDNNLSAGYFSPANLKVKLNEFLSGYFPDKEIVEAIDDGVIYFNHDVFRRDPKSSGIELMVATELTLNFLLAQDGIANAYSENILREASYDEQGLKGMVMRGYHPKRSGDITIILEPGWYSATKVPGTTHGSPYAYDTHVPVLFFGKNIPQGSSVKYHPITDIAPTLAIILQTKFPSASTGQPIEELFPDK